MSEKRSGIYEAALKPLRTAATVLNLEPEIVEVLSNPERVLTVSIPVKMDDGKIRVFTGHRVRHNTARGPAKGGLRYNPGVNIDEVKSLAFWMSIKNAVASLPYGGVKVEYPVIPKKCPRANLKDSQEDTRLPFQDRSDQTKMFQRQT